MRIPKDLQSPVVLIMGAGASKGGLEDFPPAPPVDKDFFLVAGMLKGHGTPALAKKVLKSVWELYDRIDGIGLEEYYRDIETRAAISTFAKSANKPKDWSARQSDLIELIRRVYVHTTSDFNYHPPRPKKSSAHTELLSQLKNGSTVITFNYDLVIEESFNNKPNWNPQDGYGLDITGKTHEWPRKWLSERNAPSKSKILLLKLHGSLGWASYGNRLLKLKDRPFSVRKNKVEKISILPPGWNKRIQINPYRVFWRKARLKLETCKSLMIVGYSLPETDLLTKSLFAEIIRHRAAQGSFLKNLVIVDPNTHVVERFGTMFTPCLGPTSRIFKFSKMSEALKSVP
jgi:SIR2-like domain